MWWNIQLLPEVRATFSLKNKLCKKNQFTPFVQIFKDVIVLSLFFPSACISPDLLVFLLSGKIHISCIFSLRLRTQFPTYLWWLWHLTHHQNLIDWTWRDHLYRDLMALVNLFFTQLISKPCTVEGMALRWLQMPKRAYHIPLTIRPSGAETSNNV